MVTGFQTRTVQKNGKRWAMFQLEEFTGQCKCILWSETYAQFKDQVTDDAVLMFDTDGRFLWFASQRDGNFDLFRAPCFASGFGPVERLDDLERPNPFADQWLAGHVSSLKVATLLGSGEWDERRARRQRRRTQATAAVVSVGRRCRERGSSAPSGIPFHFL